MEEDLIIQDIIVRDTFTILEVLLLKVQEVILMPYQEVMPMHAIIENLKK